jgi:hypothetical protein
MPEQLYNGVVVFEVWQCHTLNKAPVAKRHDFLQIEFGTNSISSFYRKVKMIDAEHRAEDSR